MDEYDMFDICVDTERLIIRPVLNDYYQFRWGQNGLLCSG